MRAACVAQLLPEAKEVVNRVRSAALINLRVVVNGTSSRTGGEVLRQACRF